MKDLSEFDGSWTVSIISDQTQEYEIDGLCYCCQMWESEHSILGVTSTRLLICPLCLAGLMDEIALKVGFHLAVASI